MNIPLRILLSFAFCWSIVSGKACQCPLTRLSMEECDKYDIIFKGKVLSVIPCGSRLGEAMFEIGELYKGTLSKKFKVLFECDVECAKPFNAGEEWIIYSRYKQVDNAIMDWCSRSRKYFKNEKEDFYSVTYGNDYYDEAAFLTKQLGLHRFLADKDPAVGGRNIAPTRNQLIIILLCSITAVVLFYWLFNKFFK